jgi:hypothetical protein
MSATNISPNPQNGLFSTYVDFGILESLLQVVVDGFVRYLANQREIRDSNLLLLRALEDGLLRELRFLAATAAIFFAPGAL